MYCLYRTYFKTFDTISFQVVYVKGVEAAPIPGVQGPPGTPVSRHCYNFNKCKRSVLNPFP